MFNLIQKKEKQEFRKKQGLLNQLKDEMTSQYTFNPPNRKKKKEIASLRLQCELETLTLQKKFEEEMDELTIRFMRDEINILKKSVS